MAMLHEVQSLFTEVDSRTGANIQGRPDGPDRSPNTSLACQWRFRGQELVCTWPRNQLACSGLVSPHGATMLGAGFVWVWFHHGSIKYYLPVTKRPTSSNDGSSCVRQNRVAHST